MGSHVEAKEGPIWGGQKGSPSSQGPFSALQSAGLTPPEPEGTGSVALASLFPPLLLHSFGEQMPMGPAPSD